MKAVAGARRGLLIARQRAQRRMPAGRRPRGSGVGAPPPPAARADRAPPPAPWFPAAPEKPLTKKKPSFPFTRLAGQDDMKLALLLNVVDPSIGGVLIMGAPPPQPLAASSISALRQLRLACPHCIHAVVVANGKARQG